MISLKQRLEFLNHNVLEQHPLASDGYNETAFGISMPTDQGNFGDGQASLKQPADGFMTQIMEMQIFNPYSFSQPFPRQPESVR